MKARDAGVAAVAVSAALLGLRSRLMNAHGDGASAFTTPAALADRRMALWGVIGLVDNRLLSVANGLAVIASTAEAQSCDWEQIRPLLARMAEGYPESLFQWTLPDGSTYLLDTGLYPATVSDRHYFQEALAGRGTIAELLVSRATGRNSVITAVPVDAGGRIAGLLVVSQFLEPLSLWLKQSLRLPGNAGFGAADSEGKIALDSEPGVVFRDVRSLGSPSLGRAFGEALTGREGTTTYAVGGEERSVVYATSPLTGWHYVLGTGAR